MKNAYALIFVGMIFLSFSCSEKEKPEGEKREFKHNRFPNYHPDFIPPATAKEIFELSQNYPDTFNLNEKYPWKNIKFKEDYKGYMKAVLNYCIEGNVDIDFRVQKNKIRDWYHAPWLHYGKNGREFHHGLTRERQIPINELADTQDERLENWAIGFYNSPGGYTFGKVWNSDSIPRMDLANFPEGTVSFKLLFTAAPVKKVPYLKESLAWVGNIYKYCNPETRNECELLSCISKRYDDTLRLIQIDISVKDKDAGPTGWVFGTFIYDYSNPGKSIWDKMVSVGLMWGDDEKVDTLITKKQPFKNKFLQQTILNESLINPNHKPDQAYMKHHGLGGRLNGPVDNPISSCISCHSKAANMDNGSPAPLADFRKTVDSFDKVAFFKYFSTIKSGSGKLDFEAQTYNKLDYSLQLSVGIRNFYQERIDRYNRYLSKCKPSPIKINAFASSPEPIPNLPEVSRGGN